MNEIKRFFGQNLKRIRTERGFTQEKLSERIGINQRQLTRIETGRSFPSFATLDSICNVLGVPANVLFDFSEYCEICKNGTDNSVQYYVKQTGDNAFYISGPNTQEEQDNSFCIPKDYNKMNNNECSNDENTMYKMAKNIKKPVVVEYLKNESTLKKITYNPDSTSIIEIQTSGQAKLFNDIIGTLCLLKDSSSKLKYINLAIKCLEDKAHIEKLQNMLDGMLI